MHEHAEQRQSACRGNCRHCHDEAPEDTGGLSGWKLIVPAVLVFLLPAALASAGAMLAGPEPIWELIGAAVGLAAGLWIAFIAARQLRSMHKDKG